MRFLPYAQPYITNKDIDSVKQSLISPTITRGPLVEAFEKSVAEYCGAQFAVAFTNASTALAAAYHVAKVGPNDRVITTPNSFVASIGPAIQQKATPVFIDSSRWLPVCAACTRVKKTLMSPYACRSLEWKPGIWLQSTGFLRSSSSFCSGPNVMAGPIIWYRQRPCRPVFCARWELPSSA